MGLQPRIQAQDRVDLEEANSKWMIILVSGGRKGTGQGSEGTRTSYLPFFSFNFLSCEVGIIMPT